MEKKLPMDKDSTGSDAENPESSVNVRSAQPLSLLLERGIEILRDKGPAFNHDAEKISLLMERLVEGRFHLAVLGQFKRGKSTLLNALLGDSILPTSVIPLTAIPTYIRAGRMMLRITYDSSRDPDEIECESRDELASLLERYVAEEKNPKNRLGVSQVEVNFPAPLLKKGVVLIDTPGIGSTHLHNTEATLNFLPQCDAALFLVSADPPITEVEVDFLKKVSSRVPCLFFVMNKIDYLSDAEKTEALSFYRNILQEHLGTDRETSIFPVSARRALQARTMQDEDLLSKSGFRDLETHLIDFLANERLAALDDAISRKAHEIVTSSLMRVEISLKTLEMPIAELEKKASIFEESIRQAEYERTVADDLLIGEKKRLTALLEAQAEALRQEAKIYLKKVMTDRMEEAEGDAQEKSVYNAWEELIPAFFERKMGDVTTIVNSTITQSLAAHQKRTDDLVEKVRKTAAELFHIPYHPLDSTQVYEIIRQPYWVQHRWNYTFSPIPPMFIDALIPAGWKNRRMIRRLIKQRNELVIYNVENLRSATIQNINRAFARFSSELKETLSDTIDATKGAIVAATNKRHEHADAVTKEKLRLKNTACRLKELKDSLMP